MVIDDGTRRYVLGHAGLAYTLDAGGIATSYHADALRSTRALSDPAAALTQRYVRDAWGNQTLSQGASTQPFGFTGELNDSTTGLLHLRARDYDPATGRFMQRDTRLFGGGGSTAVALNQYTYAGSNPASRRDPNGRAFTSEGGNACAAIASEGACTASTYVSPPLAPPPVDPVGQVVGAIQESVAQIATEVMWSPSATVANVDGVSVVSDAGGLQGAVVGALNGGAPAAVTWNSTLIVANTNIERGTPFMAHEMAHVEQARALGSSYIAAYVSEWVFQQLRGRDPHMFHALEIATNNRARLPWDYPVTEAPDDWAYPSNLLGR